MTDTNKPEYFLSDEQFAKLMEQEFKAAGQPPVDDVARQRMWQRLQPKPKQKKSRWPLLGSVVGVAALVLFMVRQPTADPDADLKSGQETRRVRLHWEGSTLQISSAQTAFLSLYVDRAGKPERVTATQSVGAKQTLAVPLAQEQLQGASRLCTLVAATADELQNLEKQVDLIWPGLDDSFCVPVQ